MRQLWVQLSLAFALVVVVSTILLGIVRGLSERAALINLGYDVLFAEEGVIEELDAHFANGGTSEGARLIIRNALNDLRRLPLHVHFGLIEPDGDTVFSNIPPRSNFRELSFERDGDLVATLRYIVRRNEPPPPRGNRGNAPPQVPDAENSILAIVIVGAIVGIGGGVFMSRRLTKSLSELAETARQFGGRNFDLRARVAGTEEIREVALAFNDMVDALKESEDLRSNLIADTAHELRTPLSVMEGNLRAIIDDVYPLSKNEIMHLYEQTRQLARLVNDLHELALADARELTLHRSPTDMQKLLLETVDIFMPLAEADGIQLQTDIASDSSDILVDSGRIRQVIHNLLLNALRHTGENGTITLRARHSPTEFRIEIEDTGTGIPEAHLSRIFERFYRADAARDRASGGTGLGLAIGKAIIEAHGGTITVRSQTTHPSGTRFTIRLPRKIG